MLFIGIFGIGDKEEEKQLNFEIENCLNPILIQQCRMFHFFFVPIYKWNRKYFIKCDTSKLLELKEQKGYEVWNDSSKTVSCWDYEIVYEVRKCPNCWAVVKGEYVYCPKCGTKIE